MTMDIFEKWLKDFNRQMTLLNRYVLILVDNASGHNISEHLKKDFSHVELYFLYLMLRHIFNQTIQLELKEKKDMDDLEREIYMIWL